MPKASDKRPSIFWDEGDLGARRHARLKVLPPVPETGWRPPQGFPNLAAANVIAFDVETKDPELTEAGPGWARGVGHIVGVSLAAKDRLGNRGSWYFPVRHEVGSEDNLDPRNVFGFVGEALSTPVPKVGANITYDIGWLGEEGVTVNGPLNEIQFAEALIDPEGFVALDVLARKYLGRGKTTDALYDWIREAYPNTPETKLRREIYRSPPRLVGFYAEDDANHPIDIFEAQYPLLQRDELEYVYRLECDIIRMMIAMRRAGVTVNVEKADALKRELEAETKTLYRQVFTEYGHNLASTDSRQLGPLLEHVGIMVPRTAEGNFSLTKEWLAGLEHPLGKLLNLIREQEKICSTFLQGYIIDKNVRGKLFSSFHQMKGDENGTIVGRFSSSDPNFQNIPSRTKLGKRVRDCFEPDAGHVKWRKHDYSQIHYRILAHYAVDDGDGSAEALRQRYINDPDTDYHNDVYGNVCPYMGWDYNDEEMRDFRRRPIKNVNFGLLYGQSEKALAYKTAAYFGESFSEQDTKNFFTAYFNGAPYVKPTMKLIGQEVQAHGFIRTILGRRVHFHLWEPIIRERGKEITPLPYQAAIRHWGPSIRRAFEYRGVNYKFQGSEPDIMKHGMRDCWNSGVFDYTGVPRITVHDELDFSKRDDTPEMNEAFAFIQRTMQDTIKLRIPVKVDATEGLTWASAK